MHFLHIARGRAVHRWSWADLAAEFSNLGIELGHFRFQTLGDEVFDECGSRRLRHVDH
jgi:hypothetical protein